MGESLRLQVNVPEVIALEYADGLPVASRFGGDQILFSLVDGRKLYLAPYVAQKIAAAGVGPRTPFSICKRETVTGNRRTVNYEIGAAALSESAAVPVGAASSLNGQTHANTNMRAMPAPAVPPAMVSGPPEPSLARSMAGPACGAAQPSFAPAPAPAVLASAPDSSAVALMKMAGCGAIDAVLDIERHAQNRGMTDFAFGPENIQKFAIALFIEMNRKAGRA